ncbi:MAG: EAL domain-containing protein [Sulfuricurvum sp.]|nr:EAL domain-containing protein [Sulfuricurvum sp.]
MKRKKSKNDLKNAEEQSRILRERAELLLPEDTSSLPKDLSPEKMQELLQELHIHQIELEMQNEELRAGKAELTAEKERYFDLYELAPVGYCTLNEEGEILQANLTATILLGTPKSALIHHLINKFIIHDDQDICYFNRKKLLSTHLPQTCEVRMMKSDGSQFWAQLNSSISKNKQNKIILNVMLHDITERKKGESNLSIAAIAFESQNGIIITDTKGIILRTNQAFSRITGFKSEDSIGKPVTILKSGRHDIQFYERMWSTLNTQGRWQGEVWNRRKNGEIYAELLTITAVKSEGLGVTHYVGNFSDITEDKESEAAIHRLAYYDALTGLPNRRLLQDRITQAISSSARSWEYGAVLFVDVDHFKTLNDTRGHSVGDLLLMDVAQRLRANVRQSDTVGRQGGDEFVILLDNLSSEMSEAATMAQQLGEKLREAMEKPFNLNGVEYHCKISVGISLLTKDDTIEDLLRQADLALYKAKDAGRNTLRFFDPAMQKELEFRIALESELNIAIMQEQFRLYYQPQVDSKGHVKSLEALIRWSHPQRGLVAPDDFIHLAEETGLILTIGKWVMETACSQLKQWETHPHTSALKIAVNVSAKEFRQSDYVAQVERIIKASRINPLLLKLELTESIVIENMEDTIEKMNALKLLGITFSMDDFGTGFSSLAYLAQLPLTQLKIDKSFVDNIPGTKNNEMITRTIITMGHGLEMHVIAEGVETQAQREFLEANGCTAYQGYLFSRPLPITELEEFLKRDQD